MTTPRNQLRRSGYRAARGETPGLPIQPGLCLALVRVVVEDALYGGSREFYSRYLTTGSPTRPGTTQERLAAAWRSPWANDMEASFVAQGMAIPLEQARSGDLLFNSKAAHPYGHVGFLVESRLVLENIDPSFRAGSFPTQFPNLMLTPMESVVWTTAVRLVGESPNLVPSSGDKPLLRLYDADNREVFRMPIGAEDRVRQTTDFHNKRIHLRVEREEDE